MSSTPEPQSPPPGPPAGSRGDQTGANVCPACAGRGTVDDRTCSTCAGTGTVEEPVGDA